MANHRPGPRSMTGFARQESQQSWGQLVCEIRSVNHRYLEPSFKLSESFRRLEPTIREQLKSQLGRGKIDICLIYKSDRAEALAGELNMEAVQSLSAKLRRVNALLENPAPDNGFEVLRWPGVMQANEVDPDEIDKVAQALFQSTLTQLQESRAKEGLELGSMIEQRLVSISHSVAELRANIPALIGAQQNKIRERIEALNVDIDEDRLAQEIVYIAQKADVDEELDRLDAHITEVRRTLTQAEPIGRRLDFLMQELNREANTLGSKSVATECSQAAINLKVWIEQIREQVQNIE